MNRILPVLMVLSISLTAGCRKSEERAFTGSGTFEATEILVSAQSNGELKGVFIEEGRYVTHGQTLARIDVESLRLQRDIIMAGLDELSWNAKVLEREKAAARETINQAVATVDIVRKTRDRLANLLEKGASTRDRLDKAETELSVSLSRLEAAKKQLDSIKAKSGAIGATREKINAQMRLFDYQIEKGNVISPADGTVIEKLVEQGELVKTGTPICTISDLSSMWLTIYVGEEYLGKIKLGAKVSIRVDSHPDQTFEGIVSWISSEAEFTPKNVQTRESRVDLVYAVKITVDNSEGVFKIGMPADSYIEGL